MTKGKYKRSEDTKQKLSETRKRLFAEGKIQNNFLGKKHTEETKNEMSEKAKLRIGNKNPFYGKKHSEDYKLNMSLSRIGKPNLLLKGQHKSEEHKRKVSETKKRLYTEGKLKTWNKGLTKKTDERVLKGSLNMIGKHPGEKNHTFNNWSSFKPYTKDFNTRFKKAIKERDGCCMLCNIGFEDLKLIKRQIHIHHIDYNKLNSFTQNCIALCNSCHTKTKFNRTQWKLFFQSILKERYGYKYSEDQKIIFDLNFLKGGVQDGK